MSGRERIYLDWAATAPLSSRAYEAMLPYLAPGLAGIEAGNGNANSLHSPGRVAFKSLEAARRTVARAICARPDEIIFTSGATEADNAALVGVVEGVLRKRGQRFGDGCTRMAKDSEYALRPCVIVSAIEHDAVLQAADHLRQLGMEIVTIAPDRDGFVTPDALERVLAKVQDPLLVSVMALNNETGAIMDVAALARIAHDAGALFHTDATQALGKIPVSVKAWDVDAASFSSHKVGGPKGVGALFLKARTPFVAQICGGAQESNRRSGTQNIAGVVGFAAALAEAIEKQPDRAQAMIVLRNRLFAGVSALPGVEAFIDPITERYGPHIVTVLCPGFESETLILQLDKRGICVSGGSACASRSLDPSHVLVAMGIERDKALGMLRFSLGHDTTQEEIDYAIDQLREVLETTWN